MRDACTSDQVPLLAQRATAGATLVTWVRAMAARDGAMRLLAFLQLLKAERRDESSPFDPQHRLGGDAVLSVACEAANEYVVRLHYENYTRRLLYDELTTTSVVWRQATPLARAQLRIRHPNLRRLTFLTSSAWTELLDDVRKRTEEVAAQSDMGSPRLVAPPGPPTAASVTALIQCFGRDNCRWLLRRATTGITSNNHLSPFCMALHTLGSCSAHYSWPQLADVDDVPLLPQAPAPAVTPTGATTQPTTTNYVTEVHNAFTSQPSDSSSSLNNSDGDGDSDEYSTRAYYARQEKHETSLRARYRELLGISESSTVEDGATGEPSSDHVSPQDAEPATYVTTFGEVEAVAVPFLGVRHVKSRKGPASVSQRAEGTTRCCALCELPGVVCSASGRGDLYTCPGCEVWLHDGCGSDGTRYCSQHCMTKKGREYLAGTSPRVE